MGFLESLVKRQVRRIVSDVVDEAVDNTIGAAIRDAFGNNGTEGTQNFSESSGASSTKSTKSKASGKKVLEQRLEEVFAEEWADYEVRKDLMSGVAGARNYSYGLYYNGMPRMMIMIIDGSRHPRKEERLAREASASYGVPYLDFYTHLPNEKEYISQRLKDNL